MAITRVTQRMLTDQSYHAVDSNLTRLAADQLVLDTGKRINKPSDDPSGTTTALRARVGIANNDQYQRNASDGLGWLTTIDSALQTVNTQATKAYTIALKGANTGTNPQDAQDALADEINQIRAAIYATSNSNYLGRPVFGGTTTNTSAYAAVGYWTDGSGNKVVLPSGTTQADATTADGATQTDGSGNTYTFHADGTSDTADPTTVIAYTGDSGSVSRRVGADTVVRVDSSGDDVFGGGSSGSDSIFDTLARLSAALTNTAVGATGTTTEGIEQGIADVKAFMSRLSGAQADEGARMNKITQATTVSQDQSLALETTRSNAEDADFAWAAIQLQSQSTAYQAALAATSKTVQPSLLDFLG